MAEKTRREFLKTLLYTGAAIGLGSCLPIPMREYFGEEKESLEETVCKGKEKLKVGIFTAYTPKEEQQGLASKITDCINNNSLDIFLGPEWLFVPEKCLYSRKEKESIIAKISEATKEKDTLIIPGSIIWYDKISFYNTAPVISGGKLLGEYNKRLDGGTEDKASERGCKKPRFMGKEYGTYPWNGLSVGIEICADKGELQEHLIKEKLDGSLDFYFLVSCGRQLSKYDLPPVKDLGYALCADGSIPDSEVFQRIRYQTRTSKLEAKRSIEGFMDLYDLARGKEAKGLLAALGIA